MSYIQLRRNKKKFKGLYRDPSLPYEMGEIFPKADSDLEKLKPEDLNGEIGILTGQLSLFQKPIEGYKSIHVLNEVNFNSENETAYIHVNNQFWIEVVEPKNIFLNDSFFVITNCKKIFVNNGSVRTEAQFDSNFLSLSLMRQVDVS